MPHQLTQYDFELPDVDDWLAGDDRVLAFQVVDADGNGVDISGATVEWELFGRDYETDAADAVISGADSDVELVTDNRVDTSVGEWEVRIDGSATADLWGRYWQRPRVTQSDGTEASWRGEVVLTA
jgi:hypothetical protein